MRGAMTAFFGQAPTTDQLAPSGLVGFFDARGATDLTLTGARVDAWLDRNGSGLSFATGFGGTGYNPDYSSTLFNNQGGITFNNAVQDFLETTTTVPAITQGAYTIMMVMKQKKTYMVHLLSNKGTNTTLASTYIYGRLGTSNNNSVYGYPLNVNHVRTIVNNAGSYQTYLNNGVDRPLRTGSGPTGATTCGVLQLGANLALTGITAHMDLGGFALWSRALSDAEVESGARWLMAQFALSALDDIYNIVFDGNSICLGQSGTENSLVTEVGSILSIQGQQIKNYAIIGQNTTSMVTNGAANIDPLYDSGKIAKRNIVVCFEGTNELWPTGGTASATQTAIQDYCDDRQAAGWKVVVGTILPRTVGGNTNFEADRQTVNTWLRNNYTNFADALADCGGDATIGAAGANTNGTYYSDGTHLTNAGHIILAPYFSTAINTILTS